MITLPFHTRRLYTAMILLLAAGALFVAGFQPAANLAHNTGAASKKASWVWVDTISGVAENGEGRFEGRLILPSSRVLWIDNTFGAEITLTLDGRKVYQGTESARVPLNGDWPALADLRFEYSWQGAFPPDGQIGLFQEGLLGTRGIVSPWQFVTDSAPENFDLLHLVRLVSVLIGLAGLGLTAASLRMSRRRWAWLALILALSLAARFMTLAEKFASDPGLWTMATVWDNYVLMGRGWLAGTVPVGGQIYQQGNFIYLGLLQQVIGPGLAGLYLFNTLAGSLGAVFVTLAGWALFDRRTGTLAGIITALFAPLIHYQHTLQVTAPSVLFMCVLLAAAAGLYRWRSPVFAAVSGVAVGLAGVFQGTVLALGALPLLALLLCKTSRRTRMISSAVVVVAAGLTVLPVTLTNFNAGYRVLTANLADYQLFRSNNRNSTGMNTFLTQSEQLAIARGDESDWTQALWRDIERDPLRVVELTVRRVALFWDAVEHSDSGMIDYRATGLDMSPTLRLLSIGEQANFRLLMILATAGLVVGVIDRQKRRAALIVGAGVAIYIAALALFYVIGRVRMPAAPFLILLAAVALLAGYQAVREALAMPRSYARLMRFAAILIGAAGVAWLADTLVNTLPRPELISESQLPAEMTRVEGVYNGEIKLLGYAFYETDARPGGYLTFELYWQALRQPTRDYVATFRFVNAKTQAVDYTFNFMLGTLGAPQWPSTRWSPGDILQERYLIALPDDDLPDSRAYDLFAGLYSMEDESLAALTDNTAEAQDNHVRLTAALIRISPDTPAPEKAGPLLVWADSLALASAACETDGQIVTLAFNWSVLKRAARDELLFVHLLKNGGIIDQRDARPEAGWPIDAWLPGTSHTTVWTFEGVDAPDTIRLGFYDAFTRQRWPITGSDARFTVQDDYAEFACG